MNDETFLADWLGKFLVGGFVVLVIWSIAKARYVFEIKTKDGKPQVRKGKVTGALLASVADACHESGVNLGWIGGVPMAAAWLYTHAIYPVATASTK